MTYEIMTKASIMDNKNKHLNWKGEIVGDYRPNFERLIEESECEAEAEAWRETKKVFDKWNIGFAFELVICAKSRVDGKYHVTQFPWGEAYGEKDFRSFLEEAKNH